MRWATFFILLFLATLLQATVAPFLEIHQVRPEFLLIVAVHYCLSAARSYDALLACWVIGLTIDLAGLGFHRSANVGVHALALGLIGLVIVKVRELTFRDSTITELLFTFLASLALSLLAGAYMMHAVDDWTRFGDVVAVAIGTAFYTTAVAPYVHWVLRRCRNGLGLTPSGKARFR